MSVTYWKASEILKTSSQYIVLKGYFICLSTPPQPPPPPLKENLQCRKTHIVAKKKKKETCQDLLLNFLSHKYNVKGVSLLTQSLFFRLTLNLQQYHDISLFCHK